MERSQRFVQCYVGLDLGINLFSHICYILGEVASRDINNHLIPIYLEFQ